MDCELDLRARVRAVDTALGLRSTDERSQLPSDRYDYPLNILAVRRSWSRHLSDRDRPN